MLIPFTETHGGWREGAGRKPNAKGPRGNAHCTRPKLSRHTPVHVTMKLGPNLPSLRTWSCLAVVTACFRKACDRFGFRLVHYSVQHNHVHLICEAEGESALTAGMRGLAVRLSMNLNRHWKRKG